MRILQISPAYFPAISIGGPIFSTLALAKVLSRDHDVDTLTTQLGLRQSNCLSPRCNHFEPSPCGGRLMYKRYYGYPNLTFSPGTLAWLLGHAKEYDLAILHGVWNFPIGAAAFACKWHRVPYVIFPHGTLYREAIDLRSAAPKRLLLKLYVRRMLEQAARIAFTTNDEARKVTDHLRLNVRPFIIPNIVEASDFARLPARGLFRAMHGIGATTEVLLHYGRITRKKGIEFAVRAVAALRRQGRNVVLAIVGGDDEGYKAKVQATVQDLHVEDGVIFAGLLGREEGKAALVDADIFVLPSYSENFGMAVVEAMLCRLPVVVSENVGLAEDLGRADVGVVVRLDPDARLLIQALTALLDNKTRRESLGIRGRQFVIENYDADAVRNRVNQLLNEAVGKLPRS
jgi:glycosyltransferase involved in cell wall biosynthesis